MLATTLNIMELIKQNLPTPAPVLPITTTGYAREMVDLAHKLTGIYGMNSSYHPLYSKMLGSNDGALLLFKTLQWMDYWAGKNPNWDGWFYHKHEQWLEELNLTEFQVKRLVYGLGGKKRSTEMTLCGMGVEVKLERLKIGSFTTPYKVTYYRVNLAALKATVRAYVSRFGILPKTQFVAGDSVPMGTADAELGSASTLTPEQIYTAISTLVTSEAPLQIEGMKPLVAPRPNFPAHTATTPAAHAPQETVGIPDSSSTHPNGATAHAPQETVGIPDSSSTHPNGATAHAPQETVGIPDSSSTHPNGATAHAPQETVGIPDSSSTHPNGATAHAPQETVGALPTNLTVLRDVQLETAPNTPQSVPVNPQETWSDGFINLTYDPKFIRGLTGSNLRVQPPTNLPHNPPQTWGRISTKESLEVIPITKNQNHESEITSLATPPLAILKPSRENEDDDKDIGIKPTPGVSDSGRAGKRSFSDARNDFESRMDALPDVAARHYRTLYRDTPDEVTDGFIKAREAQLKATLEKYPVVGQNLRMYDFVAFCLRGNSTFHKYEADPVRLTRIYKLLDEMDAAAYEKAFEASVQHRPFTWKYAEKFLETIVQDMWEEQKRAALAQKKRIDYDDLNRRSEEFTTYTHKPKRMSKEDAAHEEWMRQNVYNKPRLEVDKSPGTRHYHEHGPVPNPPEGLTVHDVRDLMFADVLNQRYLISSRCAERWGHIHSKLWELAMFQPWNEDYYKWLCEAMGSNVSMLIHHSFQHLYIPRDILKEFHTFPYNTQREMVKKNHHLQDWPPLPPEKPTPKW